MKKRKERISREAFSSLGRPTRTQHSPFVTLRRFPTQATIAKSAFVVTIAKKEISTAVKRNLLRRRYAHILRTLVSSTGAREVLQCIVKKKASPASYQELFIDMERLLKA